MQIRVSGSNMDIGESLSNYVQEHLSKDVKKYFENAVNAEVHFSKEGSVLIKALITINEGAKGGINVKSNSEAGDAYGAFNEALQKAAKQLRRYKRRIKNYRRHGGGIKSVEPNYEIFDATKYIIPPTNLDIFTDMEDENNNDYHESNPEIIIEKNTNIEKLSINEAIMKMDLADLPALVFINKDTNNLNVVYHRKDGNISWIDTKKN